MAVGFPRKQLTAEQMDVLEQTILFRVTQQRREVFKPKFMNCWRRTGHLIINCQDYETAEWLESQMAILSPWDGAELEAVDADLIPRMEVMEGMFWRSVAEDNETIMVYVESQNDGLSTANWQVVQRKIVREQHVKLLFTVDEATMRHFRENDYVINTSTLGLVGKNPTDFRKIVISFDRNVQIGRFRLQKIRNWLYYQLVELVNKYEQV